MNHMQNNKFESNKKYFTISVYTIIVVLICAVIVRSIFIWDGTTAILQGAKSTLAPFARGAFIAFILSPLVKWINKKFFKDKKYGLSILVTYLFLIVLIGIAAKFIFPQVINSVSDLVQMLPSWYRKIVEFVVTLESQFPYFDFAAVNKEIEEMGTTLFSIENIKDAVSSLLPVVFFTSMSVVSGVMDIFVSLVVSIYLLIDKNRFIDFFRKVNYALFDEETGGFLSRTINEWIKIFGGFMTGKLLDSLIIGIICFVVMNILRMPYAVVISLIVGITNMIPFFGPFIGAVPGAIILVMISPIQMLMYLLLILALQQFDGWYLGPKILGDSVGVRPIWIVFGVSVGGAIGGVFGMFVGVPVVAAIGYLIKEWLNYRLRRKEKKD